MRCSLLALHSLPPTSPYAWRPTSHSLFPLHSPPLHPGRSLSLLDPTYASKYIPIIASVSEHQPPAWSSYYNDLHLVTLLAPAGLVAAFTPLTDASLFLVLYAVTAVYFSGVMVSRCRDVEGGGGELVLGRSLRSRGVGGWAGVHSDKIGKGRGCGEG